MIPILPIWFTSANWTPAVIPRVFGIDSRSLDLVTVFDAALFDSLLFRIGSRCVGAMPRRARRLVRRLRLRLRLRQRRASQTQGQAPNDDSKFAHRVTPANQTPATRCLLEQHNCSVPKG